MKVLAVICRIFSGCTFLISGLLKANDPTGFGYKLESYCKIFEIPLFIPLTPYIAILLGSIFILTGLLILTGIRIRMAAWTSIILSLISAVVIYFQADKDMLPEGILFSELTSPGPWLSFGKEVLMFGLGIFLLTDSKNIKPIAGPKLGNAILITSVFVCIYLPIHTFSKLPLMDFSHFKLNDNIDREYPVYRFSSGKLSGKTDRLRITDTEGIDQTNQILNYKGYQFILVSYDLGRASTRYQSRINDFASLCEKDKVPFTGLTADSRLKIDEFRHEVQALYPYYTADTLFLKTIIRSNPGMIMIKEKKIIAKWPHSDLPSYHSLRTQFFPDKTSN